MRMSRVSESRHTLNTPLLILFSRWCDVPVGVAWATRSTAHRFSRPSGLETCCGEPGLPASSRPAAGLLVRRRETLREAHAVEASYLPAPQTEADAWDFADYGPELSRPNRGLRLWMPLVLHGFGVFREALDEKMDLARMAADGIRKMPHVRMISEPTLSLFAFRAEPPGLSPEQTDALNRKWMAKTNQQQRVFLSGARIRDGELGYEVFVLRVCVLCFRTHADRIEMLLEDLAKSWEIACGSGSW
jgi:glutamate/tyrosine decarboxylase-like PLP-dependent enzyme